MTSDHLFSKLAVVGAAGGVGSALAFHAGLSGMFRELVLLDARDNVLATHEIDLRECFVGETDTEVRAGGWPDLAGSDVVVMAAARTGAQVGSRSEYLMANLELVREAAGNVLNYAPGSFLIITTAPTDVYVMVARDMGLERHRVMGYSYNDTHRLRWIAGRAMGVAPKRVGCAVLGEHGEAQVPVFSGVTVDGMPRRLSPVELAGARRILAEWYPYWQSKNAGRTTAWSTATGMLRTLAALAGGPGPLMGSVNLEGEYGLDGVALGMALTPGKDSRSWGGDIELPLDQGEREGLAAAAVKVRELYGQALGGA
jgi:malate/lactate dehydrogenase